MTDKEKFTNQLRQILSKDENLSNSSNPSTEQYRLLFEAYNRLIEFGIASRKKIINDSTQVATSDFFLKHIKNCLNRAEELKPRTSKPVSDVKKPVQAVSTANAPSFSKSEINLLYKVSFVNGLKFLPFDPLDIKLSNFQGTYNDNTKFELSTSMKKLGPFVKWVKISELSLSGNTVLISPKLSAASLKQGKIGDCSLICSMAVSADYEFRRFPGKVPPLLSKLVFPDKPSISGKYNVTLNFNGCKRSVTIDDRIPYDINSGKPLTCTSKVQNMKIWLPTLVEKAYMKMMGGYDFPGSNSGVDMHTLFGWIPERVNFTEGKFVTVGTDSKKHEAVAWYDRMLYPRFQRGDCLVTISTPQGNLAELKKFGLEDGHAYAVLDVRKTKTGNRLMRVKNPWAKDRFQGTWSPWDSKNWTKELQTELNYDAIKARNSDDGIFWIDFDVARHFFDNLYLAWRPDKLFPSKFTIHSYWDSSRSPVKDRYFLTNNPQYKLIVTAKDENSMKNPVVWILLTRHITSRKDFDENSVYLGVMIYKSGKFVYSKMFEKSVFDGIRINSPHYLVKLDGSHFFHRSGKQMECSVVITQYENKSSTSYTLASYTPDHLTSRLEKLEGPVDFKYNKLYSSEWTNENAGGCPNHDSYTKNPKINFVVPKFEPRIVIQMKSGPEKSIGFTVRCVQLEDPEEKANFNKINSGDYNRAFAVLELKNVQAGRYAVIPSTFSPRELGKFVLEFSSNMSSISI